RPVPEPRNIAADPEVERETEELERQQRYRDGEKSQADNADPQPGDQAPSLSLRGIPQRSSRWPTRRKRCSRAVRSRTASISGEWNSITVPDFTSIMWSWCSSGTVS